MIAQAQKDFGIIKNCRSKGKAIITNWITFSEYITVTKTGGQHKQLIINLRQIDKSTDRPAYDKLKYQLPLVTAPKFKDNHSKNDNYLGNNWMPLDIDDLTQEQIDHLKAEFSKLPYVICCHLSCGGKGVRVYIRTPFMDNDKNYKKVFAVVEQHLNQSLNIEIDKSGKDSRRLSFKSLDPECYYNENAVEYALPEDVFQEEPAAGQVKNNKPVGLVERIYKYIDKMPGAVSGNDGSGATLSVACKLIEGFGLSIDEAMPYMQYFSNRCTPNWSDKELHHKLESAVEKCNPAKVGDLINDNNSSAAAEKAVVVDTYKKIEKKSYPWDKITIDDLKSLMSGTHFYEIIKAQLPMGYENSYPFEYAFAFAYSLTSLFLSCENNSIIEQEQIDKKPSDLVGSSRASFKILTGLPQVPQSYVLVNGNSSTGKNYGNIPFNVARKQDLFISSGGSPEGIFDQFIETAGNGLLDIDEAQEYLGETHNSYKAGVKSLLTEGWGKGWKKDTFSKRGNNTNDRQCNYFYPNVIFRVQPRIVRKVVLSSDVDNGFLNRLVTFTCRSTKFFEPSSVDTEAITQQIHDLLQPYLLLNTDFTPPPRYYKDLFNLFEKYPEHIPFRGFQGKLGNEILPRLYVMLGLQKDGTIKNSEELWNNARLICLWLYRNGIEILDNAIVGDKEQEQEDLKDKIFKFIKVQGGATKAYTSRGITKPRGTAFARNLALTSLIEDGLIRLENNIYQCNKERNV